MRRRLLLLSERAPRGEHGRQRGRLVVLPRSSISARSSSGGRTHVRIRAHSYEAASEPPRGPKISPNVKKKTNAPNKNTRKDARASATSVRAAPAAVATAS